MNHDKMMKELRSKEDKELRYESDELARELFDIQFKSSSEGVSHPARIRQIRRRIARINTILRERSLGVRGQEQKV